VSKPGALDSKDLWNLGGRTTSEVTALRRMYRIFQELTIDKAESAGEPRIKEENTLKFDSRKKAQYLRKKVPKPREASHYRRGRVVV